jgi:antirestriction protein ArdC
MLAINDIYQEVTDRIVSQLEKGVAPWRRPWTEASLALPRNVISGAEYRGVNFWLLGLAAEENGWQSSLFGTYRQWKEIGGHVRRGEHGTRIVFWKVFKRQAADDESGESEERRRFFARGYTVFALEQCGGESLDQFRPTVPERKFIEFEPAEKMIAATGAAIRYGGNLPFYDPQRDFIQLPVKASFESPADFYSTACHELCHWTGHPHRLDRALTLNRFGDDSHAIEELVAEMGAAYLTAALDIPNTSTIDNSASYVASWLQVLRSDAKAVFTASSAATKSADFILRYRQPVLNVFRGDDEEVECLQDSSRFSTSN